jgi:hypothetical protein
VAQPDGGRRGKTITLQQLRGEIALGQMLDFRQTTILDRERPFWASISWRAWEVKLIGQNGDVRLLQAGGVKDVYDLDG